jgi:hypothetical protein
MLEVTPCHTGKPYGRDSSSGWTDVGETNIQKRTKVGLMNGSEIKRWIAIVLAVAGIGLAGCNPMTSSRQGLGVVFENPPRIYQQEVYFRGQTIGQILDQETGRGSVHKVTIQLAPEHLNKAASNWVFYVDKGRLNAFQIAAFGNPPDPEANICGFGSKAALNWFRFRTLLTNRIYKAGQIANDLTRRFG